MPQWTEKATRETFTGQSGPLVLKYGDETLTFPGCAVDYADLRMERGREINMRILDRRWKWRSPIVTYRANVPLDTESIRADTARTPAQIAQALFTTHLLPFEIAAFVLLAALIGVVVLHQRKS